MELLNGKWVKKKVYYAHINGLFKKAQGKKLKSGQHTGMAREDDRAKGELLLKKNKHKFYYLRQDTYYKDLSAIKGVSMKAIILKVTRPNREEMPFEHLTFKRIDYF